MRRVVVVAVVLACLALAFARCRSDQSTSTSRPTAARIEPRAKPVAKTPGSISGRVLDEKGGALAGATVCVSDERVPCVTSDAQGAYALAPLPPAKYHLSATAVDARTNAPVAGVPMVDPRLRLPPWVRGSRSWHERFGGAETRRSITRAKRRARRHAFGIFHGKSSER